jgi:hypothetical protein
VAVMVQASSTTMIGSFRLCKILSPRGSRRSQQFVHAEHRIKIQL